MRHRAAAVWCALMLCVAVQAARASASPSASQCRPGSPRAAPQPYDLVERSPGEWAAPNAVHHFEAVFSERGVVLSSARGDAGATARGSGGGWTLSLELFRHGSPGNLSESQGGWPLVLGPSVDLGRDGILESFLNSRKGLLHRLTLERSGEGGLMILDFYVPGSLFPKISLDGQSVVFNDDSGVPLLAHRRLHASDAEGREVSAHWETVLHEGGTRLLRMLIDAADQPAPITVRGTIVSPKRAASVDGASGGSGLRPDRALAAPVNDTCAGAEEAPGGGPFPWTSAVHDITDATTTGDPATPSCQPDLSRSIWFRFTPGSTGPYTFSLCSDETLTTLEDTVIALYSSTGACSGLSEVTGGCDDDSCSAGELQSVLSNISLSAGTTYYIVAWKFDPAAPPAGGAEVQLSVSEGSVGGAPPNDQCAGSAVIPEAGPFPYLAPLVPDVSAATSFGDPPAPSCQANVSRSIWYSFTPATSGSYTFTTCADAGTGTTVDDTVMALYASAGSCSGLVEVAGGCNDDGCAMEAAQSVLTGVSLTSGTTYHLVVWQFDTPPPAAGNTAVQVKVIQTIGPGNDTCGGAIPLSLDSPVSGTTAGAVNDLQLPAGGACFAGLGHTASTATGAEVLYRFTAPSAGNYSFRLNGYSQTRNAVLYVSGDCPAGAPGTIAQCLGASNRNAGGLAEEVMCLPLAAGQPVWVAVDEHASTAGSAFNVEVNLCTRETEPNGTPAEAGALSCGVEGSVSPLGEADYYALGAPAAGSRVFSLLDGVAANNTDFDLRVTTAEDTLEFDDLNNDLAFGGTSPNVAGTPLTGAEAYLRVNHISTTLQVEPYRVYAVVQPPSGSAAETEPNNTPATASAAAGLYFAGFLASTSDLDHFGFTAQAGELVTLGLDLDPARDNTPFNGTLALLDGAGTVLLQVNDTGATSNTTPGTGSHTIKSPAFPAESLAYRIRSSGTYVARVSTTSGTAGDYLLSIARNCRIGPPTNLAVATTDSPDPVAPGAQVTYTVTVSNVGGQPATGVSLRDDLPPGTSLVSAVPSQGSCSGSGPVICALGSLAASAAATVQVTVTAPGTLGDIVNSARAASAVIDTNPADDMDQETTTVGQADSDNDGVPDGSDCAPIDPGAWAVPGDATDLIFPGPGTVALQWSAPAAPGGPAVRYDLLRSVSAGDFTARTCVASDQPGTTASDGETPATLFFYLVRSENVCGSSAGAASDGTPHTAPSCP